jgi:hypothetical protein
VARPRGAQYPKDVSLLFLFLFAYLISLQQRYVDASAQTDDPDSTLAEIDPTVLIKDCDVLDHEVNINKWK